MSQAFRVDVRSIDGGPTALGWGESATVVIDRPPAAGGCGLGFSGGQLLNIAVAGCISNDLFREAARRGIRLDRVRVSADSDYAGDPATCTSITYQVEVTGDASDEALAELVAYVDEIAEIPNSIRRGTEVRLTPREASSMPTST
jgi:uncharacterized OsmC-like protein